MARIPDDELARLEAEVSVERLVEARGVVLAAEGGGLVGVCPFCAGVGVLVVDPAANTWRCGAGCGGGSVLEWVVRAEGVSRRHAVELLRSGMAPAAGGRSPGRTRVRRLGLDLDGGASDGELLGQVVAFYRGALAESPETLAWLAARGVADPAAVERFGVGLADRTLGYRLPERSRVAGAELRGRLQALGVLRASGHEHFRGCVTVPVLDGSGGVVQLYGRRVGRTRADRGAMAGELWLPGGQPGVWNLDALATSGEVIVCSSPLDALVWWCAGFHHVAAAGPDPGAFVDACGRFGVARVLVAYGRPDGEEAAAALAGELGAAGVGCFRVVLPRGTDVGDLVADTAAPAGTLGEVLRAAAWMGAGPDPRGTVVTADGPARPGTPRPDPTPPVPGPAVPAAGVGNGNGNVVEPASVSPLPAPPPEPDVTVADGELRVVLGERRWRVRGLGRASSFDVLRLNVLVARDDPALGGLFHVDTLDLYSARARAAFVHAAAGEIRVGEEVVRRDLGRVLVICEEHAADAIRAAQTPTEPTAVTLSTDEEAAALELLRDPDLVGRIVGDFERAGIVGEATNLLVGYLAAVSRKVDTPLAVLVQSMSAAGKSSLLDAVLGFVPAEDRVQFSAMTGQSLFYMGESDLAHKLLAVVEEEGASRASYALKLLQSEGELSIASTGKDPTSGRLTTQTYRVAGPVALFLTTTAAEVDEELANRCVVLSVDEDRAQTRAIHAAQRRRQTLDGLLEDQERRRVLKVHQDAQRLLEPVLVANPFAPQLGFANERTRTRRDHVKYLTLIRAIALLHQHQRPRQTITHGGLEVAFVEVTVADIALANRLAHDVLGRSLDELAPQTRRLLELLDKLVGDRATAAGVDRADVRFGRREVRGFAGWSDFQVRTHLGRLVDLEYVLVHRGGRGQSFVYELLWDGAGLDGGPHLTGLTDPAALVDPCDYGRDCEHPGDGFEGPSSPQRGAIERGSSDGGNGRWPAPTPPVDGGHGDEGPAGVNGNGAIAAEGDR